MWFLVFCDISLHDSYRCVQLVIPQGIPGGMSDLNDFLTSPRCPPLEHNGDAPLLLSWSIVATGMNLILIIQTIIKVGSFFIGVTIGLPLTPNPPCQQQICRTDNHLLQERQILQ